MTQEELELNIKKRVNNIKPSRASFESTMKIVTSGNDGRYNTKKESIPSPYQLIKTYIMKRNILIGAPIALVLIITIMVYKKTPNEMRVNNTGDNQVAVSDEVTNDALTSPKYAKEDLSSVDTIVDSFINDASAETTINTNEQVEEQSLYADLEYYNNLKTYTYDDTTI